MGTTLKDVLTQVNLFVEKHSKEIIILDFNHIYHTRNNSPDALARSILLTNTMNIFKDKLCPISIIQKATVIDFWKEKCQVLVLYKSPKTKIQHQQDIIISPFNEVAFTQKSTWLNFLNRNYIHGRPDKILHVTQGIMQPHWTEIAIAGVSEKATLRNWVSDDASLEIVNWLKNKRSGKNGVNIVIADFIENHEFVETVLSLNNSGQRMHSPLSFTLLTSFLLFLYLIMT